MYDQYQTIGGGYIFRADSERAYTELPPIISIFPNSNGKNVIYEGEENYSDDSIGLREFREYLRKKSELNPVEDKKTGNRLFNNKQPETPNQEGEQPEN